MENLTVNSVYGQALFEAAADSGRADEVTAALAELSRTFKENPQLFALLKAEAISVDRRKETINELFGGRIPDELLHFLLILTAKHRMSSFFGIANVYAKLADERNGITAGRLVTAVPIEGGQVTRLESETGKLLHKNVRLHSETDASLLGGYRIYIDGRLIDASIRTRLDKLKETLI